MPDYGEWGLLNGSASGEIIVHFGVFLNSKIKIRGRHVIAGSGCRDAVSMREATTAGMWQGRCSLRKEERGGETN